MTIGPFARTRTFRIVGVSNTQVRGEERCLLALGEVLQARSSTQIPTTPIRWPAYSRFDSKFVVLWKSTLWLCAQLPGNSFEAYPLSIWTGMAVIVISCSDILFQSKGVLQQ